MEQVAGLTPVLVAVSLVMGLVIGSFLNVVIYRVPLGLSIVSPGSACPNCHHPLRPTDNIPVISWLVLRGRCRDCRHLISAHCARPGLRALPWVDQVHANVLEILEVAGGQDGIVLTTDRSDLRVEAIYRQCESVTASDDVGMVHGGDPRRVGLCRKGFRRS